MKHQAIRLEIWDKLLVIRHLGFCNPDLLQLTEVLEEFFCVLGEFCVDKFPFPVVQRPVVRWFLYMRLVTGWDHKWDLLVIESVHVIWVIGGSDIGGGRGRCSL